LSITATILDADPNRMGRVFRLNVRSMFVMIRAFLPKMLESGSSASIINMASTVSSVKGAPKSLRLWRHKGGGHRADQIGRESTLSPRGSAGNAICPGTIETPSLEDRIAAQGVRVVGGTRRRAAPLSSASRWVGLAMPRGGRTGGLTLPQTNPSFTTGAST